MLGSTIVSLSNKGLSVVEALQAYLLIAILMVRMKNVA